MKRHTATFKHLIGDLLTVSGFESVTIVVRSMAAGRPVVRAVAESSHLIYNLERLGPTGAFETSEPAPSGIILQQGCIS